MGVRHCHLCFTVNAIWAQEGYLSEVTRKTFRITRRTQTLTLDKDSGRRRTCPARPFFSTASEYTIPNVGGDFLQKVVKIYSLWLINDTDCWEKGNKLYTDRRKISKSLSLPIRLGYWRVLVIFLLKHTLPQEWRGQGFPSSTFCSNIFLTIKWNR